VAIGFIGAVAAIAFREAIAGLQWLFVGRSSSFVDMAESVPWYGRIVLPALGGVVAGLLLQLSRRFGPDGAASDYMEAIAMRRRPHRGGSGPGAQRLVAVHGRLGRIDRP